MSAYLVSKKQIVLLVESAISRRVLGRHGSSFHYSMEAEPGRLESLVLQNSDREAAIETANMLLAENNKSVNFRYGEDTELDQITGEEYEQLRRELGLVFVDIFRPVQVIAFANNYDYQACEHPGYPRSKASAFIRSLIHYAIYKLDGYGETFSSI